MALKISRKILWCAYNHMPGGQIVATHFMDVVRTRKLGGDQTEDILFTADEQFKGFKKSDFVNLFLNGKLIKNEALIYDGPDLYGDPHAADRVIAWAIEKGLRSIISPSEKVSEPYEHHKRIEMVEERVVKLEGKIDLVLEKLSKPLDTVKR